MSAAGQRPPTSPLRVGVVGAGKISAQYSASFAALGAGAAARVTAVADLDAGRAAALATAHPGARATSLEGLLAADDVDVVLNLTIPAAHADVALAALAAGKHVYGEKPLAATAAQGREVVAAGRAAGLRVACAPDTVLGPGVQTARAALDAGAIGAPHAATAFMTTPGHERWHPDPDFYYAPGGGPLLDMGPYYLSALVHLLGPVRRVVGASSRPRTQRTIGSGPREGQVVPVTIDTHVTGVLEHTSGALTTLVMSFDTWAARLPRLEVYGDAGSLSVPDPNRFEGPAELFSAATADPPGPDAVERWELLAPSAGYTGIGRGCGLVDLALALDAGSDHRASGDLALHVLEVMEAVQDSADAGRAVELASSAQRPAPVEGLVPLAATRGS